MSDFGKLERIPVDMITSCSPRLNCLEFYTNNLFFLSALLEHYATVLRWIFEKFFAVFGNGAGLFTRARESEVKPVSKLSRF